ncbi:MAG TPA: DUF5663 domain-containing protein [Patescibacteria group bacterium]|nr:DUF5663 domain-containing protein [Patescibacteria group bacterium]
MKNKELLTENIIKILDIEGLPTEKKQQILDKMVSLVQKKVMLRVAEDLTPEQFDELEKRHGNDLDVLAYLAEIFPNFAEMVEEETKKIKEKATKTAKQVEE